MDFTVTDNQVTAFSLEQRDAALWSAVVAKIRGYKVSKYQSRV